MIKLLRQLFCHHECIDANFLVSNLRLSNIDLLDEIKFTCRKCGKNNFEWRHRGNKKIMIAYLDGENND